MFTNKRILYCACMIVMLAGCSEGPVNDTHVSVDTCGTLDPLSSYDSLRGNYPFPFLTVIRQTQLNDEYVVGYVESNGYRNEYYAGVYIRNENSGMAKLYEGWHYDVSPDRKKVAISYGVDKGFYVVTIPDQIIVFEKKDYGRAQFRMNDDGYYVRKNHDLYILKRNQEVELIGAMMDVSKEFGSNNLLVLNDSVMYVYNIERKIRDTVDIRITGGPRTYTGSLDRWDIDEHTNRVLLQHSNGIGKEVSGGVYLVDVEKKQVRLVLPQQYWGTKYYPAWSAHGSIYGSYYCRNDSVSMIYEWSTSGQVIRKVTSERNSYKE